MKLSLKAQIEIFHLMFLRQFNSQVAANLYAIKGGCNLRFFFNSMRYSEDLDIDIQIMQKQTLEKKVNKILSSAALQHMLQRYGIMETTFSSPKQTQTTQRWKIQLRIENTTISLHTKIEFSRRQDAFHNELANINIALCQQYRLPPTRLSHYDLQAACTQKIYALAKRSLTQSRDVFDLYLLISSGDLNMLSLPQDILDQAQYAMKTINFAIFKSQVINFLEPEYQNEFGHEAYWNTLLYEVNNFLNRLKK